MGLDRVRHFCVRSASPMKYSHQFCVFPRLSDCYHGLTGEMGFVAHRFVSLNIAKTGKRPVQRLVHLRSVLP